MVRVNVRPSKLSNRPVHASAATVVFDEPFELDRLVSCCLLGEDTFYVSGQDIKARIFELANRVDPAHVARLAVHARHDLGLRHAPLWLLVALANRCEPIGPLVREATRAVLRTPRDALDLAALYMTRNQRVITQGDVIQSVKRGPIANPLKKGIRDKFCEWSEFQLARYATLGRHDRVAVRLRDLLFLTHPDPRKHRASNQFDVAATFRGIADDTIPAPDTWEARLPFIFDRDEKRAFWTGLLENRKIGALALLRNLWNLHEAGVAQDVVEAGLDRANANDVWAWQVLSARKALLKGFSYADRLPLDPALERLMYRAAADLPRLKGKTGILVDVSSSMDAPLSGKSHMLRYEAAIGLAVVATEMSDVAHVASFSNQLVGIKKGKRGFDLAYDIQRSQPHLSTLLSASVDAFLQLVPKLDRLIVLTDEQAQQEPVSNVGVPTFIINLAPYQRGVEWDGEVTRINGWSTGVLRFITKQLGLVKTALITQDDEPNDDD